MNLSKKWMIRGLLIVLVLPLYYLLEYIIQNNNLSATISVIIVIFLYYAIEDFLKLNQKDIKY